MEDRPTAKRPFFTEADFPGFEKPMSIEHRLDCVNRANAAVEPLLQSIEAYLNETEPYIATLEDALIEALSLCEALTTTTGHPAELDTLRKAAFDFVAEVESVLPEIAAEAAAEGADE